MTGKSRQRCAIYTRKSSEEGLDQDFNSLDAQREACEAFIASQTSLAWKALNTRYDDGGHSGGHMNRPALRRLLDDIQANRIDIVVVYKIDRLTRSLMDFARIVDIFDQHGVSFVSVTQQFNTTTSMGRLSLNVLLSFAQFEREITAERIRDKIAASKKKGMWMGGLPPLGYDNREKQLIVNRTEAKTVRQLFDLYLEEKSVAKVKEKADQTSIVTKKRIARNGATKGGKPFSRGNLYQLLSNPIYAGQITHHGERYPGRHQAIIGQTTWDAVQRLLHTNAVMRGSSTNTRSHSLLAGLVFDETGDRLSPSHAVRDGKRYRYYISHRLMQSRRKDGDGWRLPAYELEHTVCQAIARLLDNEKRLIDELEPCEPTLVHQQKILRQARYLARQLDHAEGVDLKRHLKTIIRRVTLRPGQLVVELDRPAIMTLLAGGETTSVLSGSTTTNPKLEVPFIIQRRGVEAKLTLGQGQKSEPDLALVSTIAKAHDWLKKLTTGGAKSIADLAAREKHDPNEISRLLPLAFLAPDIVEGILAGTSPIGLTATRLTRLGSLPCHWSSQRKLLGFTGSL